METVVSTLFFSYSHKDEELRNKLEVHLTMLKRQGLIETWHDRRILAGSEIDHAIDKNLDAADVILLLVSPDFIASDYCYEREVARAMERHERQEAAVIPVILRACDWHEAPFGKLLAAPTDGKPVNRWADLDEAFLNVVTMIKKVLARKGASRVSPQPATATTQSRPVRRDLPRSSNLRVSQKFTEEDKDQFLHETFGYIAAFFENSLEELVARAVGVTRRFRRIDANRFTAVAYRNGDPVSKCTVFIGNRRFGDGICYSSNDSGYTNSWNTSLSVAVDEQSIYLQAMGMSYSSDSGEGQKLTMQGAAEAYWAMFMRDLQR
jgi:hypothetical protein